jgi:murein L,D-transpeptidase YafK
VQQSLNSAPAPDKAGPTVVAANSTTLVAASRAAAPATRVDARTTVSVRSSERFEPLYSVPLPSSRIRVGAPTMADSIVVYKRERTLTLFYRGVRVKSYFVALGSNPVGDKQRAGDQRTPEGLFHVNAHNPASKFHLALRISYPDDAHRARAAALGADPGGDIMIHGLPPEYSEAGKDQVANDWTNGCVALSNAEIEELWRAVPDGTPVQIKP